MSLGLLLNPRVLIALGILALLAFTHITAYRKGENHVRIEWAAATAAANEEARGLERSRQRRAEEAGRMAAAREDRLRAGAARAAGAERGLRDAIAAERLRNESCGSANQRAATYGELLGESAAAYRELAEACDRHVNDIRLLQEAWPVDPQ